MLSIGYRTPRPGVLDTFPFPTKYSQSEPRLAYFDVGSGPVILLVHGLGSNFTHFEHLVEPLARAHRVIGVDMPGCGDSAKPRRRYTLDLYVDSTLRLLDELGIDEATLVGHSLGGQVVTGVALKWPERVSRLVLISAAGFRRFPRGAAAAATALLAPRLVAKAMERLAPKLLERCFHGENEHTRSFMAQTVGRPAHPTVDEFARTNCSLIADLARRHFLDDVERILQPTLVIWGDGDRLLPVTEVPRWVARLPAGRLKILRDCGHLPIVERAEETVAAMLSFIGETRVREAIAQTG